MKKLAVLLAVVMGMFAVDGSLLAQTNRDIAGTWQATVPGSDGMRMVLKVEHDDKAGGGLQGVLYPLNPDYGSRGREATAISLQGPVFKFAVAPIEISFEGRLSVNGASVVGTWTQGKQAHELTFDRATPENTWVMAETPKAMARDADPEFEVATIKPAGPNDHNDGIDVRGRHLILKNETVNKLIAFAWGLQTSQIVDGPSWFSTDHLDIDGVFDLVGQPSIRQMQGMMQKLLADRFQFKFHREKRELSVYAVTVGKTGPKLQKSLGDPDGLPNQNGGQHGGQRSDQFTNVSMNEFALILQFFQDRPVVNETGLAGKYDFALRYAVNDTQADDPNAAPGLFTAIQEQLGLKLEAKKAQADVYVVDHVEKPSSN